MTVSAASSDDAATDCTLMYWLSHFCSAACTVNCVAAAISTLLGAKGSCSRPLPKSGRFTRSPGEVNSTCSTSWRT